MGKTTSELEMVQDEIDKLPKSAPDRDVWRAVSFFFIAIKDKMDESENSIGEIKRVFGERFLALENEVHEMKDTVKQMAGDISTTKLMVSSIKNGKTTTPAKDEKDTTPERTWFIEKVLPGLIQTLIISIVAVIVTLIVANIKQIVP